MKFSGEMKFITGTTVASIAIIVAAMLLLSGKSETNNGLNRSELLPNGTVMGQDSTVVNLVEYSDFQCPACKAYQPIVDQLLEKYKDKIVFDYRHFPLPQHQFAFKAAEAAEAAREQGKFLEMYRHLFSNQLQISDQFIKDSGKVIGLDEQKFQEALNTGKHKAKVAKDAADGKSLGVNSTPTFFLNGKKLTLKSFSDLEKAVEQEVANLK